MIELIEKLGHVFDYPINGTMFDVRHRMRSSDRVPRPPRIIVKFIRRLDADTLLAKRRVKRSFNTSDFVIHLPKANVVYVNESLYSGRRRLLNAACEVKMLMNYASHLWVRGGRILMRTEDGRPVKVITGIEDLNSL